MTLPWKRKRRPDMLVFDRDFLAAQVTDMQRATFADGYAAGVETCLTLALGRPKDGGIPYAGPELPDAFVFWAESALAQATSRQWDH